MTRGVSGDWEPGQCDKAGRVTLPVAGGSLIGSVAPGAAEDGGSLGVDLRWG
jgi:hypothetical protein